MLPFFPLFFLPVFADGFVTVLVARDRESQDLDPWSAIPIAFASMGSIFRLKFRFFHLAFWWSLVPVFGWYKSFRIHEWWAQASNVVILEKLSGYRAFVRCQELVEMSPPNRNSEVFSIIPAFWIAACLLLVGFGVGLTEQPVLAAIAFLGLMLLEFPVMSAVNTMYYFSLPAESVKRSLNELVPDREPSDYCPTCRFFDRETSICSKLYFNVERYPRHFTDHCNGRKYVQRSAA